MRALLGAVFFCLSVLQKVYESKYHGIIEELLRSIVEICKGSSQGSSYPFEWNYIEWEKLLSSFGFNTNNSFLSSASLISDRPIFKSLMIFSVDLLFLKN